MGTTQHYRSFGVIVNTAQRIQSLNKLLGTRILASAEVVEGLTSFLIRPLGAFMFAGLTVPLDIYEIVGRKAHESDALHGDDLVWLCAAFSDAVETYKDGQWQVSIEQLLEILELFPDDGPSHYYLRRCEYYRHHLPTGLWNSVIHQ